MTKTRPVKKARADPSQTGPLRSGESNSVRVLASPLSPHNHLDDRSVGAQAGYQDGDRDFHLAGPGVVGLQDDVANHATGRCAAGYSHR
jgi:hypothetical protein